MSPRRNPRASQVQDPPSEEEKALEGITYLVPLQDELETNAISVLFSEVNRESITPVLLDLLLRDMGARETREVTLLINSEGGNTHHMWPLIDTMQQYRGGIATIGMGWVCSAAALILAAGTPGKRFFLPNTTIMIHTFKAALEFSYPRAIYETAKETAQEHERFVRFWQKVTGKTRKQVEKIFMPEADTWFTVEEALEHGIADHIWKKD